MKNAKQILCILLIFLLGAASGGLAMHIVYKSKMETFLRGDRKAREEMLLNRLTRRLDLDSRQREQVRAIVGQTHAEMDNIRKQYRPQMEAVLEKSRAEMRQILRPDQREKFEQFIQKRKAMHEKEHRD
jgi:Spy/CpxP family protein refolding chaperone